MPNSMTTAAALLVCMILIPAPGAAQTSPVYPQASDSLAADSSAGKQIEGPNFFHVLLPTTIGVAAGAFGGYHAGEAMGWGGDDDSGLQSAVIFGTTGGLIGATAGAYLMAGKQTGLGRIWGAAAIGALGGLAGAFIAGATEDGKAGSTPVWLAFSAGQGAVTSLLVSALGGSR